MPWHMCIYTCILLCIYTCVKTVPVPLYQVFILLLFTVAERVNESCTSRKVFWCKHLRTRHNYDETENKQLVVTVCASTACGHFFHAAVETNLMHRASESVLIMDMHSGTFMRPNKHGKQLNKLVTKVTISVIMYSKCVPHLLYWNCTIFSYYENHV